MGLFNTLRPLLKITVELRRIANALEYFAAADARDNNRMFVTGVKHRKGKDDSELLHTDPFLIQAKEDERLLQFLQGGTRLIEQEEEDENG